MPPKRVLDPNRLNDQRAEKCWWRQGSRGPYLTCKPFQRTDLLADKRAITGAPKLEPPGQPWRQQDLRREIARAIDAMVVEGRRNLPRAAQAAQRRGRRPNELSDDDDEIHVDEGRVSRAVHGILKQKPKPKPTGRKDPKKPTFKERMDELRRLDPRKKKSASNIALPESDDDDEEEDDFDTEGPSGARSHKPKPKSKTKTARETWYQPINRDNIHDVIPDGWEPENLDDIPYIPYLKKSLKTNNPQKKKDPKTKSLNIPKNVGELTRWVDYVDEYGATKYDKKLLSKLIKKYGN